jgi:hypothetical protein
VQVEITGWDSVVFTFTPPRVVFARILASVLLRWPAALVENLDESQSGPERVVGFSAARLPTEAGDLSFYRDAAMAGHQDQAGYVSMPDGDGPFRVIARLRRDVEFEMSGLDELRVVDEPPGGALPPDSYQAWLCTPVVFEITAVTPGDPTRDQFSSWVLSMVKRACSELADHPRDA